LETHTGRVLREDRLREVVSLSAEMFTYLEEIDELRKNVPTPIHSPDHYANIIAPQFFRGTKWGTEHCRKLRDEVKERVEKGLPAIENEKIRLVWTGYPPWFSPGLFNAFEKDYGAVFVWEAYHYPPYYSKLDPTRPLESIAKEYCDFVADVGLAPQSWIPQYVTKAIEYKADGAIIAKAESCKALSSGTTRLKKEFDKVGMPSVILSLDYVDSRNWNAAKVKGLIASFIETLQPLH